jgi:maltooligosyltrehalose trehalohydrolase
VKLTGKQPHVWGPRPRDGGAWEFALWAASSGPMELHLDGVSAALPMERGADGVHRVTCRAEDGARYQFSGGGRRFADPASRQQAEGAEGWSVLRDLSQLPRAADWPGRPFDEAVFCELHIGTFTPEGTFAAAARSPDLKRLAEIGITALEIMPVAQFPGQRGWGYDPVLPYAPQHSYGTPEDLAGLVAAAQDLGLMVFLDVVFNHFGPTGAVLPDICPEFFTDEENDWGQKIAFQRPEVRAFFIGCALHWLECYGFDGLRIDALHEMDDSSDPPIAVEWRRRCAVGPGGGRCIWWPRTVRTGSTSTTPRRGFTMPVGTTIATTRCT